MIVTFLGAVYLLSRFVLHTKLCLRGTKLLRFAAHLRLYPSTLLRCYKTHVYFIMTLKEKCRFTTIIRFHLVILMWKNSRSFYPVLASPLTEKLPYHHRFGHRTCWAFVSGGWTDAEVKGARLVRAPPRGKRGGGRILVDSYLDVIEGLVCCNTKGSQKETDEHRLMKRRQSLWSSSTTRHCLQNPKSTVAERFSYWASGAGCKTAERYVDTVNLR